MDGVITVLMQDMIEIIDHDDLYVLFVGAVKVSQFLMSNDGILMKAGADCAVLQVQVISDVCLIQVSQRRCISRACIPHSLVLNLFQLIRIPSFIPNQSGIPHGIAQIFPDPRSDPNIPTTSKPKTSKNKDKNSETLRRP